MNAAGRIRRHPGRRNRRHDVILDISLPRDFDPRITTRPGVSRQQSTTCSGSARRPMAERQRHTPPPIDPSRRAVKLCVGGGKEKNYLKRLHLGVGRPTAESGMSSREGNLPGVMKGAGPADRSRPLTNKLNVKLRRRAPLRREGFSSAFAENHSCHARSRPSPTKPSSETTPPLR